MDSDGIPIASTVLRLMTAATFAVQLGLLWAAPIPSPVSARRMWRRRSDSTVSDRDVPPDPPAAWIPALAALTGVVAVLVVLVRPAMGGCLLPVGTHVPAWLSPAGAAALLAGNLMIAAAALTLKRRTVFDADGKSVELVTDGVFSLCRHPIVAGMGLIYLGLFLVLPSPLVLGGLIGYGCHQQRRLVWEEILLEKRFGRRYRRYRRRVGRFGPRWSRQGG